MKIVLITNQMNNPLNKNHGTFNVSRVNSLKELGHDIKVISPISLTPPEIMVLPIPKPTKIFKFIRQYKSIPERDFNESFERYYPKYLKLPRKYFWYSEVDLLHFFSGRKINKIIKKFKPDIIITSWMHPFGTYAKYIKQRFKIPIISILEGSDILLYPNFYKGIYKISKDFNRYVDKIICVSNAIYEKALKYFNDNKLLIIKNGYDVNRFYFNAKKTNKVMNKIKVIVVGSLLPKKGHDILLRAIKELNDDYYLTIIGDGLLREEYEYFIKNNDLKDRVTIIGEVPHSNIKNYLEKNDIFCIPSRSESFGIAALEAMACGLPVVATRVGGLPEIIIEGFNGNFCKLESPKSLLKTIIKTKNTNWNHQAIANWTKENFGWNRWAKEIQKIIFLVKNKQI